MSFKSLSLIYLLVTTVLLISIIISWPDSNLHLIACDVGQGDAFLIKLGFSQILVDGGKDGQVVKCLDDNLPYWDRTLDVVIASHDDHDHIGGVDEVLKSFKVKNIYWNGKETKSVDWNNIVQIAQQKGTKLSVVEDRETQINGIIISFLSPKQAPDTYMEDNIASVVNKVSFGSFSVLFTGDIDNLTEENLIRDPQKLASTVLKVSHHGSRLATSDVWINSVNPKVAMIGVGKNSYGHPTKEVLDRLQQKRMQIFRTDKDGAVEIVSDGKGWWAL